MSSEERVVNGPPMEPYDTNICFGEILLAGLKKNNVKSTAQVEMETGRELTFGHLARQSLSMVQGLKKEGIGEGDVVCIVTFNSQEAFVIYLATLLLGATAAPIDPALVSEEMAALMDMVGPKLVYTEGGKTLRKVESAMAHMEKEPILVVSGRNRQPYISFQSLLQPTDPEFRPKVSNPSEHTALILFTSGTTGLPKAVMLSDLYLIHNAIILPRRSEAVMLHTSPLFWVSGAILTLQRVLLGLKAIYLRGPAKPDVILSIIQNYKVNIWLTAPTAVQSLNSFSGRDMYDLSSLQWVHCGGSAMSAESQLRIQRELFKNKTALTQAYGMTEVGILTSCFPKPELNKPGSAGMVRPGVQLMIQDLDSGESLGPGEEGEVCAKSDYFMLGYKDNLEATKSTYDDKGWFHTGDIGYYDDDGFLYVTDRIKDLIKYKSYQIAPAELENVLMTHPSVKDAAVFGIPHPTDGDHATAFVVAQKNISENQLLEYVSERVSENKQLRGGIRFVEFIPRTATGKPKRRALRSQLMSELQGINFMKRKKSAVKEKKKPKRNNFLLFLAQLKQKKKT